MKLIVEFNSYQEIDDFMNGVTIAPALLDIEASESKKSAKTVVKEEKPKKAKKVEEVKEEVSEEEEPKAEDIMPAPQEEVKKYAIEDVRAVLGKLQKAGKKEEVKALIASFGVDKLSQIKEEDYAALIEKAGALDA